MGSPPNGAKGANGLIAVLLITRSRPGPKLVFHYPPVPQDDTRHWTRQDEADSDGNGSDSDCSTDSDSSKRRRPQSASDPSVCHETTEESDPLGKVLGHEIGSLERLLSPGRWSEKKKFEICLDGVTFVGLPVFAKEDGTWAARDEGDAGASSRARPAHRTLRQLHKDSSFDTIEEDSQSQSQSQQLSPVKELSSSMAGITITAPESSSTTNLSVGSYKHMPDSFDSHGNLASLGTSMNSSSTTSGAVAEQMTMFHVVFALSAKSSSTLQTAGLYEHVAKKLSKALKYCQKRSNYVSTESRKLLAMKQRGRAEKTPSSVLWPQFSSHSELAWALQEVYTRISAGEIAGLRLDGMEMALQVPLQQSPNDSEVQITALSTILLLDSRENLVRTLDEHRDASLLSYFIRESIPTKSLAKQATKLNIPEKTIIFLAQHLVKWRKARVITPLHPRNLYVVSARQKSGHSRGSETRNLRKLGIEYAKRFPALPSMETMLAMLGGRPLKYGALIQSRDHRVPYMEILAWLVRHELVAQLRTVGWLQCPERSIEDRLSAGDESDDPLLSTTHSNRSASDGATASSSSGGQTGAKPMPVSRLLGVRRSIASASDDGSSVASDQTAFPTGVPLHAIASTTSIPGSARNRSRGESVGRSVEDAQHSERSEDFQSQQGGESGESACFDRLIADPLNPTPSQKAALRDIEASLDDMEFRERFPSLVGYFNGEHAFEEIAGREGLKRARVEEWIAELEGRGCLRSLRCL
jgi:hypothetical protein